MNQIYNFSLVPCSCYTEISLNPAPLEGVCTADPLPKHSLQKAFKILPEFWVILTKLP